MKVAIQGAEASFHDIAARKFFADNNLETISCDTFAECFAHLKQDKAEFAMVAIENSLYGSINLVYDLLLKHKFSIIGEVYLQISQCLIGLPDARLEDISEVYSHPVAMAQCEDFLEAKLAQANRFEHHDTAASVQDVKSWNDPKKAAIASAKAAELHGLKILAEGIESNKHNYTRFIALSKQTLIANSADKSSLVLITSHQPGSLYKALGVFAKYNVNLFKLQSRPIIGKAWNYMFYVDIGISKDNPVFEDIAQELANQNCEVLFLGSYQSGN